MSGEPNSRGYRVTVSLVFVLVSRLAFPLTRLAHVSAYKIRAMSRFGARSVSQRSPVETLGTDIYGLYA